MGGRDLDRVPPSGGHTDGVLVGQLGEADVSHASPIYLLWCGSSGWPLHRAGRSRVWDLRQAVSGQIQPKWRRGDCHLF
ncbi:hypothetical protein E2562_033746 [Oryza meyeriana var. granulata]|uniref:Uncharacterized protein n=1 Tax=Oryza meyeriana var. granulata TaxID=110450 RepID=A0A6G1E6Y3_9ORYZ|nr:hypothetical protein E2562_033746 [Oryza meyeriana var. granulata]